MSAKRRASTTCTPASNAVSCRRHVSFCSCRLCQSVDVVGETLEGFGSGVRERGVHPSCGGGRDLLRRGLCCHRSVLVGGDGELCRHAIAAASVPPAVAEGRGSASAAPPSTPLPRLQWSCCCYFVCAMNEATLLTYRSYYFFCPLFFGLHCRFASGLALSGVAGPPSSCF